MTTTNTTPTTTAEKVLAALTTHPGKTAVELAEITGLVRSTVTKQLAALERDGQATRTAGVRKSGRRVPDRWSPTATVSTGDAGERLRPGELNQLVLAYVANNPDDAPHSSTSVSRGLGRSSGAVANCLARLTVAGQLRLTSKKPRSYDLPQASKR